jgi:hypothetical protein
MTLDGQVLLIAFLAMSLELIVREIAPGRSATAACENPSHQFQRAGSPLDSKVD